jgi:hypothetical protein
MAVTSDQDVNWKVTQGDTFSLELKYEDPDGNPIDLTGFDIIVEIKNKPGGKILSAKCTIGDGVEVANLASGIMEISISPEKTRKFNLPRASYQIQGTDQYGENTTFLQGWFLVNAGTIN